MDNSIKKNSKTSSAVREHYDQQPFYLGGPAVMHKIASETPLGEFVRTPSIRQVRQVIDVGCGSLAKNISFLKEFGQIDKPARMIGTDISWNSLLLAHQHHPQAIFVQADTAHLPFADDSFDFATATGTVHHMPDPRQGVSEILRTLKSGHYLYLSVYNKNNIYRRLYRWAGFLRFLKERKAQWLVHLLFLPPYILGYWLFNAAASRQLRRIPIREAVMDFYDKFMVPVAHFYSEKDLPDLVGESAQILSVKPYALGMMLGMMIKKPTEAERCIS